MTWRVLVTGAQGFVGRHTVAAALVDPDAYVLGLGRSPRIVGAIPQIGGGRYAYESADVGDVSRLTALVSAFEPTAVIHLASGLRDDEPGELMRTNVLGTLSLVDAIGATGLKPRILVASSGGVYGKSGKLPLRENAACIPIDVYSASKLAQEHVARIAAARWGLDLVMARIFNVIGPGQDERHVSARFARQLVELSRRQSIIFEVGDLSPTRDFIDVRDVASAVLLLVRVGTPWQIVNIANGVETPIRQLLDLMKVAVGMDEVPHVTQTYHRQADITRHVADVTKLNALGHRREYSLARSVQELVDLFMSADLSPCLTSEELSQCV